jgi:hypothetical protein
MSTEAKSKIEVQAPTIKTSGTTIEDKATTIKIQGTDVSIKGVKINSEASGIHIIQGLPVKIN